MTENEELIYLRKRNTELEAKLSADPVAWKYRRRMGCGSVSDWFLSPAKPNPSKNILDLHPLIAGEMEDSELSIYFKKDEKNND
ncbi:MULTISPECIES: hypothetical protein [unclassified Serratia (in: enterobacteria)]|uniref:hypothetical protein n=1 Tax=unclassified Serratia (in: enterobacteria) TaxID=2647522 RepID=UPI0027E9F970|nr:MULTISPECIES: hypothetical protein [unclassified Serratia (in: enterobacteria)]MDQ7101909.1 hypothetical protein [Serratia sp. MF2]MDQ7104485.1 hypothetical protein [Serratia sp. MF1(2023)]